MAAVDLKTMDKKKVGIILVAIILGLVGAMLAVNYIEETVSQRSQFLEKNVPDKREFEELKQFVQGLQAQNQQMASEMRRLAEMKMSAPAVEQPKPKEAGSLSVHTPTGKRAITVMIDKLAAVGGLVNPGDKVDILAHLSVPADPIDPNKKDKLTVTLFQNIEVLAVGLALTPPPSGVEDRPASLPITFALSPDEASFLTFAQQNGTLQLVLRSSAERAAYAIPAANWSTFSDYVSKTQGITVFGQQEEAAPMDVPEPAPQIQIFRGGL